MGDGSYGFSKLVSISYWLFFAFIWFSWAGLGCGARFAVYQEPPGLAHMQYAEFHVVAKLNMFRQVIVMIAPAVFPAYPKRNKEETRKSHESTTKKLRNI